MTTNCDHPERWQCWIGQPHHNDDDARWFWLAKCHICGAIRQVEVTNTASLARWKLTQELRRPVERLMAWMSRAGDGR